MTELIISFYDSGYCWSVSINGKISKRDDDYGAPPTEKAEQIARDYQNETLNSFVKKYRDEFQRIVICEDGFIEIWEELK